MELKVWRQGRPNPIKVGLQPLDRYLAELALDQGWLVIFDQRPELPPMAERTTVESALTAAGRAIAVIRA